MVSMGFNMEPENDGNSQRNLLFSLLLIFQVSMLNFRGVNIYTYRLDITIYQDIWNIQGKRDVFFLWEIWTSMVNS